MSTYPIRSPGPARPVPVVDFSSELPVCARRGEIERALRESQVVVVCGETGSGKTTQLPKIALGLGRGLGAGGTGLIGHTQPRRIAAASVARRIAEELGTALGEVVGYKVRFQDRLQSGASVKLMTDGILLAETQSDPLLSAYDTLIIDEAHERSLNIDFLLGYLRQLLPRRPDLKVVVTSATIDSVRFAEFFARDGVPAPVVQVSGRLYPVELRWRPFEEGRERDLGEAISGAVDELWQGGRMGDVLVFLPGEREIREVADHLRGHFARAEQARRLGPVEVLPLFARLSQAEQDRVFERSAIRRLVLATNVAETSLTVPGIRFVIDSGLARVKRYSYRSKVEQLLVEPISRAAAEQRAGRCGRVAEGICIRLYDQTSFESRPRFTDPEILRASLAGVILRMKSLGLGAVQEFPFLDPPPRRAITDGQALLTELDALDERGELTERGRQLARLPLDPRVGRMILAARERDALEEVLVIAAALSVPDVRDRPLESAAAADTQHRRFDDERSEFNGYLKLWRWIDAGRGVHGHGPAAAQQIDQHRLSNRQQEMRLREAFVSPRRVREWRDTHTQLRTVVAEQGWRVNGSPATYEQVHLSLLAGLLGNIGCRTDDEEGYLGARGIRFFPHPGAHLSRRPGRWVVAAELVETTRLYGRSLAAIDPQWIPALAGHLLKRQLLEPHWEKTAAEVIALERATLYGIVIYNNRRVRYASLNPAGAREIFIREALVAGDWDAPLPCLVHNRRLMRQIQELEHKSRRQDVLVDETLIQAYYEQHLPPEVCSGATMQAWYREASRRDPGLLHLTRDELMRHQAAGVTSAAFPSMVRLGGVDCAASYLHEPGNPRDGLTLTVPLFALNQVPESRGAWLVPGMLRDKLLTLLKSLPQRQRSRLVPLPQTAQDLTQALPFGEGDLLDSLCEALRQRIQLPVLRSDFKAEAVPAHLLVNWRIVDDHGRQLGQGRNLAALKAQWSPQARTAFQALASLKVATAATPPRPPELSTPGPARPAASSAPSPSGRLTDWTFGELPELLELRKGGQTLVGFPALVDHGTHVEIEVHDDPAAAARLHRAGVRRLLALQLREPLRALGRGLVDLNRLAAWYLPLGSQEDLRDQVLEVALERAFLVESLPQDEASFRARLEAGRPRLGLVAQEVVRLAGAVLAEYAAATRKLRDSRPTRELQEDVSTQIQRLVGRRFLQETPWAALHHLPRYLKAVVLRLDKWRTDPVRDAARLAELRPLQHRWLRRAEAQRGVPDARLDEYRWLLEELRVSLFAQELRTPQPISVKRLDKVWAQLEA